MARKLICGRKKKSFDARNIGIQIANGSWISRRRKKCLTRCKSFACEKVRDLKCVEAFGNGHGNFVDSPRGDRIENRECILRMIKVIFPSLQRAARAVAAQSVERVLVLDYSLLREQTRN